MPKSRYRLRLIGTLVVATTIYGALALPTINPPQVDAGNHSTTNIGVSCYDESGGGSSDLDVLLVLDASSKMTDLDPSGIRRSATTAFINGLGSRARAGVVVAGDDGQVAAGLSTNRGPLVRTLSTLKDGGLADLGSGVGAALDEFATDAASARDQVIVLMTDGNSSWDEDQTVRAADAGVQIFTIGLGGSTNAALLSSIARRTGGTYAPAVPLVGPSASPVSTSGLDTDRDGDGLSDCEEQQGAWDGNGIRHVTGVNDPDTDGDGLTDGREVTNDPSSFGASSGVALLRLPLDVEAFRYVVSDPNLADSDGDGASDPLEFDLGTAPFAVDTDGDDLPDFAEVDRFGTDPLERDSDSDGRDDGWEVGHASAGFDPVVYDEDVSNRSYATDFAIGAVCPEGIDFCQRDTVAFLAGSIGGGFAGYKDVLDFIGNLSTLDFVGAGLAASALLPVAGDGASVGSKAVRFLRRVPARTQIDGIAYVARAERLPVSLRVGILDQADAEAMSTLKKSGVADEGILALGGSRIRLRTVADAARGASRIEKSPQLFTFEREAQDDLAGRIPGSITEAIFPCPTCPPRATLGSRRVDIYDPSKKAAIEVKKGYIAMRTVRDEVTKDVALLRHRGTPIKLVTWQFFPDKMGRVGPDDALRELLIANKIPYVLHLP